MQQIDFLPSSYRQQRVDRKRQFGHVAVIALFAVSILGVSGYQHLLRAWVDSQIDELNARHDEATATTNRLASLKEGVQTGRNVADLLTYLRHPWPRSRILAAVFEPLPESITVDSVQIAREEIARTAAPETAGRNRGKPAAAEEAAALPRPVRDLAKLQQEINGGRTVVTLTGTTSDGTALHLYLAQMSSCDLVAKAELTSIENRAARGASTAGSSSHFVAKLILRPGYSQPAAPPVKQEENVVKTALRVAGPKRSVAP